MAIQIKSIRLRSGDWDHCFSCKPKKVKATHEIRFKDNSCWIPLCKTHCGMAVQNSPDIEEWRLKAEPRKQCQCACGCTNIVEDPMQPCCNYCNDGWCEGQ